MWSKTNKEADRRRVRMALPGDAGLIADISRKTFYASFASFNEPANMEKFMNEQFSRERLMAECLDPENIFFLAYAGEEPVGYMKCRVSGENTDRPEPHAMEIVRIYTMEEAIGKGFGSLLMDEAIRTARREGCSVLWLGVWEHNARAIAFYKSRGFEKYGEHVFMLGDDPQTDFLLMKRL